MEKRTRLVVSLSFASFLLAGGLIMSGCSKSSDVPPTAQAVVATVGVETPTVVSVETPAAESLATQAPDATTAVAESTAITEAASLTATGNKVTIENVTFSSDPALATSWSGGLVEGNSDPNVPPNPFTEPRHVAITATTEVVPNNGSDNGSSSEPYLYVYKVSDLDSTPEQNAADALTALLAANGPSTTSNGLPHLPLVNAAQVIHGNEERLHFANGDGIRYVAAFAQDPSPFLGSSFVYTFQGLTSDGQTYVALVWPLSTELFPSKLPADFDQAAYMAAHDKYLTDARATLNNAASGDFTPDLGALDALVKSISIGE